jgi:hypothetical protein
MLPLWDKAQAGGHNQAIPTLPPSRCAAAAVAPTRRLGLPPEYSAQLPGLVLRVQRPAGLVE